MDAKNIYDMYLRAGTEKKQSSYYWDDLARYINPYEYSRQQSTGRGERFNDLLELTAYTEMMQTKSFIAGNLYDPKLDFFTITTGFEDYDRLPEIAGYIAAAKHSFLQELLKTSFFESIDSMLGHNLTFGNAFWSAEKSESKIGIFKTHPIGVPTIARDEDGEVNQAWLPEQVDATSLERIIKKLPPKVVKELKTGESSSYVVLTHMRRNRGWLKEEEAPSTVKWIVRKLLIEETLFERSTLIGQRLGIKEITGGKDLPVFIDDGPAGFMHNPICAPYWEKMSWECYGRSPSLTILSTAKLANRVMADLMRGNERSLNPDRAMDVTAVQMQNNIAAGEVIQTMGRPSEAYHIFDQKINLPAGGEFLTDLRNTIAKAFYRQEIEIYKQQRQSATEVYQREADRAKSLSPLINSFVRLGLMPALYTAWELAEKAKLLPEKPQILKREKQLNLYMTLTSPLVNIQKSSNIHAIVRLLEVLNGLAAINPNVIDKLDPDKALEYTAVNLALPPGIIRSDEQVEMIREERARVQQEQDQMQGAMMEADMMQKDADAQAKLLKAQADSAAGVQESLV